MDRKKEFGVVTLLHILVKTLLRMELATSRWKLVIRLSLTWSERIYWKKNCASKVGQVYRSAVHRKIKRWPFYRSKNRSYSQAVGLRVAARCLVSRLGWRARASSRLNRCWSGSTRQPRVYRKAAVFWPTSPQQIFHNGHVIKPRQMPT